MYTTEGSTPSRVLPLKYVKNRRPMEINKAKITIAFISILLHLYLLITFPLTEILHPPVTDIWTKPPGSSIYIVAKAFPVATDKKTKDRDIKRNDRIEKYKTSPPLKPDFTEKRRHLIKQVVRHTEKRTIHHMFTSEHKILLAQVNPASFSVSSRQMPAFARTRVVTKLAADSKSMPRPRMKKMADFSPGHQRASELQRYTKIIKDKIANNIFYPPLARRKGIEGMVLIRFLITNNGLLRDIRLIEPSDYEILNRAAITTINNASPFLPFPESINKKELWLKLALSFKLGR